MPLPKSHTTYKIVSTEGAWLVYQNEAFIAGFAARFMAEWLVQDLVEAGCKESKASKVLIEDEQVCETLLCRCFKGPSPGALLS